MGGGEVSMPLSDGDKIAMETLRRKTIGSGSGSRNAWTIAGIGGETGELLKISAWKEAGGLNEVENWVYTAISGKNYKRSANDSEAKALCDLDWRIPNVGLVGATRLYLYGNWGPCPSCKLVIKAFCAYHGVKWTIMYQVAAHASDPGLWPNGNLYGFGDEEEEDGVYFKRQP